MTIFTMFFIELMAARFDVFGHQEHDLESSDPSKAVLRASEKPNSDTQTRKCKTGISFHSASATHDIQRFCIKPFTRKSEVLTLSQYKPTPIRIYKGMVLDLATPTVPLQPLPLLLRSLPLKDFQNQLLEVFRA
jgi:hypothetical protein